MSTTPNRPRIEPLKINEFFVILDHEKQVAYSFRDATNAGVALFLTKQDPDALYNNLPSATLPGRRELYAAIEAERASGELTPADGTADTEEGNSND